MWESNQQPFWDSATNQFYIKAPAIGRITDPSMGSQIYNDGSFMPYRKQYIGAEIQNTPSLFNLASISTAYTPNQFTANQLANFNSSVVNGGNTIPAWMHNAFANKMGRMGAPTTEPFPYQITGSSFRGMPAGKAAPTGGNNG